MSENQRHSVMESSEGTCPEGHIFDTATADILQAVKPILLAKKRYWNERFQALGIKGSQLNIDLEVFVGSSNPDDTEKGLANGSANG